MDNHSKTDEEWAELHTILTMMDVPKARFNDTFWLNRNLGISNGEHPQFPRAMELLRSRVTELRRAMRKMDEYPVVDLGSERKEG